MQDANGFLDAFESGGSAAASQYINSLLISKRVSDVLNDLYRDAGAKAAKQAYGDSEQNKAFGTLEEWFNAIMQYISTDFYNAGILRISETTRKILTDILGKAIAEGWGYAETARYFNEVMPGISRNRAEMIARTESGKAIHAGQFVGADKSKWEKEKIWIAAQDNRTRGNPFDGQRDKTDHYHMNGQTVDFTDPFFDSRANTFLSHPHDPKAGAASVINCRCTFAVVNKVDAQGVPIPKNPATRIPARARMQQAIPV